MKVLKVLFSLCFLLEFSALAIPKTLPPLKQSWGSAVKGKRYELKKLKGPKGLLVVFHSLTCPFVNDWEQRIHQLSHFASKKNIGVVWINSFHGELNPGESLERIQEHLKSKSIKYPYLIDSDGILGKAFSAQRVPTVLLYDEKNELVYYGAVDNSPDGTEKKPKNFLKDAMTNYSQGKAIRPKQTRIIGCQIQYRSK